MIINLITLKCQRIYKCKLFNIHMDGRFHAFISHNYLIFLQTQLANFKISKIWVFTNITLYGAHLIQMNKKKTFTLQKLMKAMLPNKHQLEANHYKFSKSPRGIKLPGSGQQKIMSLTFVIKLSHS
jgi:hypothetical protein